VTLLDIKTKLAELNREARQTDKTVDELQRAAKAAHARAALLKQRSDDVQRKLAAR
jgi:hypothetical protein